jgi:hypothetical protein
LTYVLLEDREEILRLFVSALGHEATQHLAELTLSVVLS